MTFAYVAVMWTDITKHAFCTGAPYGFFGHLDMMRLMSADDLAGALFTLHERVDRCGRATGFSVRAYRVLIGKY